MKALIIGGTGKVGRAAIAALTAAGVHAVAAARHPAADGVALDLRAPETLEPAAAGFDVAFLITPLGPDETHMGLAAVAALQRAGVHKIVYLSIMNIHAMREIPHFETKIPIRDAVLASGTGVVLEANFFFQNDMMMLPAMLHGGVYPLPVGSAGLYSVDAGDIGAAAARALTQSTWDGAAVPLCGPERLTGPIMANIWSTALGRKVTYGGDALAPFMSMMSQTIPNFGAWEAHDFETMMRVTQEQGCPASPADIVASTAIVGRPLRRYADFVATLIEGHT